MTKIRLVTSSSLLVLGLASACSTSDDVWYPPGSEGGKADAFTTIKGSDIPSQYVSASKSYLIARRIDSLKTAGALDMVEAPLADRIDGIIANMPDDGKLHLAELVRMEDPAIFDSLFAAEAAALPKMWAKMEAPSTNDLVTGPDVGFGVLDMASPPGPAVPPASLAISSLATTDLQNAATRLQNVYNADNNTSTVQIADLDSGVANPGAFTQAEVTAFGTIKAVFREKAVAVADATLVLSAGPGPFSSNATLGPIGLQISGTTRIEEERNHYSSTLTLRLTAIQNQTAMATLPQGAQVLVINKDSANEVVFGSGAVPSLVAGPHVVEVWNGGQRVFVTNAVLPATTKEQRIDLTDKLDYTVTTALAPLVRNVVSATYTGSQFNAKFSYDKTAVQPMVAPNATALQRVATPKVNIPVGRYTFSNVQTQLLVFPNDVLWIQRGNAMYRLLPQGNGGVPTRFYNNQINAYFETTNNSFYMSSPSFSTVLNASMRDI
ncbi:MAG TPA: hypothetical protein VFV99_21510 [Kofleriaceae bacterium]|nr:hypothetical protein [Kofleriaceae bacterium]